MSVEERPFLRAGSGRRREGNESDDEEDKLV
jgi:hypothetical protein